ncbi:dimethyl sulfoxide reductase anchor subunit family protein [Dichotomicrobium thermohalophilum]|uniref:DMSO reductase anchor subunit n=1 Tax=Dichotomicrobium thermohalophilum TaxID=933063 RepID=A0A397Q6B8_9HYPH|nr:DmsC/YnfH family molybdoenzyme membrane anchor subunit [Dichotomicrobium thermohalophilum]RIA56588.1 DMSO reductase anchor subunit [Dichotomicrobium thermohalophilum]
MHPAYSVIAFTTMSGAGYGLLALLGISGAAGLLPAERWFGLVAFAVALGLVTAGLLASTFHLGHPERAWRAFTQWRSSWLSREGVAAVVTYVPAGLYAIGWVFLEQNSGLWAVAGWLTAICAAITVYCTAMIYASLRTIPRWHNRWVPPVYLALGLATGAVLLALIAQVFGLFAPWMAWLTVAAFALGIVLKLAYWGSADNAPRQYTAEQATGLGGIGKVRQLEAPHTQANFVQREMGYQVARKHADRLRRIVLVAFAAPALLLALAAVAPTAIGILLSLLAAAAATIGVAVERWLFFAEAEHIVTLYYGAAAI